MTGVKKTSKKEKTLRAEILDLEHKIDRFAVLGDEDVPEEIKKLRHRIFFVHNVVEFQLTMRIISVIIEKANPAPSLSEKFFTSISELIGELAEHLNKMTFRNKYEYAKSLRAYSGELLSKIGKLNEIRNTLAHTRNQKYKRFVKQEEYKKALETSAWILEKINGYEDFLDRVERLLKEKLKRNRKKLEEKKIPF